MAQKTRKKGFSFFCLTWKLVVFLFKAACVLVAVATPVLGVWVSSSLAAYLNGPLYFGIALAAAGVAPAGMTCTDSAHKILTTAKQTRPTSHQGGV
jgi:hypothetical protein